LRALVIAVIVVVAFNTIEMIAQAFHATLLVAVLTRVAHARGFTLGIACGTLATTEPLILAVYLAAVFLLGPVDIIEVCFAAVAGGMLGVLLKSFVRAHHERQSLPDRDAH
jgi:hypothetical protein